MSTKAVRAINIFVSLAVLLGAIELARIVVDSFWTPAVIIGVYIGLVVLSRLTRIALNRRERAVGSGAQWTSGIGFIHRVMHPTEPMNAEEALAALERVVAAPARDGRQVTGRRCTDCGHEVLMVVGGEGPPYAVATGVQVIDQQVWVAGVMGFWMRETSLAPEQAHDVQPQVAGSDAKA